MNYPVGVRFHPTEQEIITYFLERKMDGLGFPVLTIADVDVRKIEPWDLPQHSPLPADDQVWYFFNTPVYKHPNGELIDRQTKAGFWKVTGPERKIRDKQGKKEIGFRRTLVFYRGRAANKIRTNWVMHEYNSHNTDPYQKKYVLFRLKYKSRGGSDACNEPSHHLVSNSGRRVTDQNTNPQINNDLSEELTLLLHDNGPNCNSLSGLLSSIQPEQRTSYASGSDHNPLSSFVSMIQAERGTSYSDGFDNQCDMLDSVFNTSEQEDAFVNSLWADQDAKSCERSVHTRLHDFNPTKSLRRVYVGDSSDGDTEIVYEQSGCGLENASLFDGNVSSEEHLHMSLFNETSSSSDGRDNGFHNLFVDSDTDMSDLNCLELVIDEVPTNIKACKAQHTTKYNNFIEEDCAPERIQLQRKVSPKAAPKVEVKESAKNAVDLPGTGNAGVKFGKDQKTVQATNAKTSLKFRSRGSHSDNRNASFITMETPPINHKINPPSVYLGNVLVSLLLIIFIIRQIVYLH